MAGRFTIEAVFKAVDKITAPVSRMQNRVQKFSRGTIRSLKKIQAAAKRTGSALWSIGKKAAVGFGLFGAAVGFVVSAFSKIENARAAFQPILGSIEKATALVEKLNETAATTPFQFEPLAQSARVLIAMGAAGEDNVIPMLRMLGDLAGGSADNLNRMAINFAEISANGKAMTKDLRQFTTAGVPLIRELADMLGKTTAQIQDMASKGTITDKLVTKALQNMTSEGGKFFRGMQIASQTTTGKLSTLRDNIMLAAATIGEVLAPTIKELIDELIGVAREVGEWAKANKKLIGEDFKKMVKLIRTFFIFLKDNGPVLIKLAKWTLGLVVSTKVLIGVLTVLNLVMAANPAVLIILAIIAAVTALVVVIQNFDAVLRGMGNIIKWVWDLYADFFDFVSTEFPILAFVLRMAFAPVIAVIDSIVLGIKLVKKLIGFINKLRGSEDQQRAAQIRAQAVSPVANAIANLTEEELANLDAPTRIAFGLPPKAQASSASAVVTIRDESGRAVLSQTHSTGVMAGITLEATGDF